MSKVVLQTPLQKEDVAKLKIGEIVYINGVIFTMRDLAHLRLLQKLAKNEEPPENFFGAVIFHAGPVAKKQDSNWVTSVIGPTTSMRMEPFSETILGKLGVKCLVGKGGMGKKTQEALIKYCGVYLLSPPGCAVIQAKSLQKILRVHWLDLGMPEALWVIQAENWGPLTVAMDAYGNNIFEEVKNRALNKIKQIYGETYCSV
jgi:tartrate/fumarate subfamily iron-sulfur-dependent hydro-lyase beta chain